MAAIELDQASWPVVLVRFPSGPIGDADFASYLAALTALGTAGEPYATVSDLGPMRAAITPAQRRSFDDWMERTGAGLVALAAANAIVAPSPLARSIARTVYWHWRDPPVHRVFDVVATARRWCERRVLRRATRRGRLEQVRPPIPARPIGALASLIDLIREPAFLLDTAGTVVFANRAAVRAGPLPTAWLARVHTTGPGPGEPPVQLLRIDDDGRTLRLVIFDQGLALAGLPPSLRRVAERLARGQSDREIAAATGLALATVRTYVRRLYARTDVHDRRELMRRWLGG